LNYLKNKDINEMSKEELVELNKLLEIIDTKEIKRSNHDVSWFNIILYPSSLLSVYLGSQYLLKEWGINDRVAVYAALPTTGYLVYTLPQRIKNVWKEPEPWKTIGLNRSKNDIKRAYLIGFKKALILISILFITLFIFKEFTWKKLPPSFAIYRDTIFIAFFVGILEKLLFRGWLMNEMKLKLGKKKALWIQAIIYSLAHNGSIKNLLNIDLSKISLLLKGLELGIMTYQEEGNLWTAIGYHGGLISLWFFLKEGIITIKNESPVWIFGHELPTKGIFSSLAMILFLLNRKTWYIKD